MVFAIGDVVVSGHVEQLARGIHLHHQQPGSSGSEEVVSGVVEFKHCFQVGRGIDAGMRGEVRGRSLLLGCHLLHYLAEHLFVRVYLYYGVVGEGKQVAYAGRCGSAQGDVHGSGFVGVDIGVQVYCIQRTSHICVPADKKVSINASALVAEEHEVVEGEVRIQPEVFEFAEQ